MGTHDMQRVDRAEVQRRPVGDVVPQSVGAELLAQGAAMQQVGNRYATSVAVQKPRSMPIIERNVLYEADKLGETGFYGWGEGKDAVGGATVKLAMMIARNWGNVAIDLQPVQDLGDSWIFTASFVDLETGFNLTRQFRQSKKWVVYGKHDEARKEDIRFQIGQSKAVRNVILNAVPEWLVDRALDKCRDGVREKMEKWIADKGLAEVQRTCVRALARMKVPESRILATYGRNAIAALTVEDLIGLRAAAAALESGAESLETLFPVVDATERADTVKAKAADVLAGGAAPRVDAGGEVHESKPATPDVFD